MEEQNKLDSWDGFVGVNFLKAEHVKDISVGYIVDEVEMDVDGDRPMLILSREGQNESWRFSLNVSNSSFLKASDIANPSMLKGKKIWFRKTTAFSPSERKEVPTLRIDRVE